MKPSTTTLLVCILVVAYFLSPRFVQPLILTADTGVAETVEAIYKPTLILADVWPAYRPFLPQMPSASRRYSRAQVFLHFNYPTSPP